MNQVGKHIKKLRKERDLSQEALAELLHVTRQAVSNWENGKTQPDLDMLERLAAVFQVDILVVIYGQLPKQEEEVAAMDEKTKKRHIRGAVLFGCIALACLILHLASRETMLNAYHRYEIPSFWWLMAVSMPLFYFFIALSGMNGLGLLGTLRIQNVPLRRSLFLLSAVFLAVCVIFPVVLFQFQLSLGDAWGRYVFWLYYGITKYPALLILPGVGVYFGWER